MKSCCVRTEVRNYFYDSGITEYTAGPVVFPQGVCVLRTGCLSTLKRSWCVPHGGSDCPQSATTSHWNKFLTEIDKLTRQARVKHDWHPLLKGVYCESKEFSKEKRILSFYCSILFWKGFVYMKANRKPQKFSSWIKEQKNDRNVQSSQVEKKAISALKVSDFLNLK